MSEKQEIGRIPWPGLSGRIILAPFGYKYANKNGKEIEIAADNPWQVRALLLSLSDDPEFQEAVKKTSFKEIRDGLKENGFRFVWKKHRRDANE